MVKTHTKKSHEVYVISAGQLCACKSEIYMLHHYETFIENVSKIVLHKSFKLYSDAC